MDIREINGVNRFWMAWEQYDSNIDTCISTAFIEEEKRRKEEEKEAREQEEADATEEGEADEGEAPVEEEEEEEKEPTCLELDRV